MLNSKRGGWILAMLCLSFPMAGADLKVDHATVAALDLQLLESDFVAAGLEPEYGGEHPEHLTEMAIISFADGSYLELIGKAPDADAKSFPSHPWAKFMQANAGPCAWAVEPQDLNAEVDRLRKTGLDIADPKAGGRERADGMRLVWTTAQVKGDRGAFFPFMIHDVSPRQDRAFPSAAPGAPQINGVLKVVIATLHLDDAIARYRKAYGWAEPKRLTDEKFGAMEADFENTPVILAAPLAADNWIADRLRQYGDAPCAFILSAAQPGKSGAIRWLNLPSIHGRIGIE